LNSFTSILEASAGENVASSTGSVAVFVSAVFLTTGGFSTEGDDFSTEADGFPAGAGGFSTEGEGFVCGDTPHPVNRAMMTHGMISCRRNEDLSRFVCILSPLFPFKAEFYIIEYDSRLAIDIAYTKLTKMFFF
jgi:hypothetical protein